MRHKGKIGQDIDHPAVFPVALPEFVIEAYSDAGDIVYEPFGGSGTTMLACERTGRQGRAVEIAPEYVDVAIKRFQQNFPEVPVTLNGTGQSSPRWPVSGCPVQRAKQHLKLSWGLGKRASKTFHPRRKRRQTSDKFARSPTVDQEATA